jgi:hypothetical protein
VFSRHFLTVLILFASLAALAQDEPPAPRTGSSIIDDSTKNVYGPTTSRYFYESDFFRNDFQLRTIDTTAWNFHRFNYVQRYNNFYQDLGNIGTAIRPIFTEVTETIGATPGFTSYDLYWNSETVKYYNTKSPFASVQWVLGGKGRSYAHFTFNRNINPRWNVGFDYRILQIDKITARQAKGDRAARSNYFDIFTSYQSKDSTYSLFLNARRDFIQVDENGGVKPNYNDVNFTYSDLFDKNASTWLTEAESNDKRGAIHLFHQLNFASGLQLYHIADLYRQKNRFNDEDPHHEYYDFIVVDSAQTRDRTEFKSVRNEVGVKGSLFKIFYNGYAAFRKYNMDYKYFYEDDFYLQTEKWETYVGGRIGLQLDSLVSIKGWAESMLDDRYMIQGSIKTKWFEASAKRSVSTPGFLPQAYRASHDMWINYFENVQGTEFKGNLIYESKVFSIYPGIRFSTVKNFIFLKEDTTNEQHVLPYQTSGYQTWASPELNLSITLFKHLTLKGQGIYTKILENSDDAMQYPELFINAQIAYADIWFNGNLDFQFGVDTHWKSSYFAPGYDVTTQQFYTQQQYLTPSFPIMDIFLNARIKRARIFVKYNNALMTFTNYGNVPTPFYPGLQNVIDFGFDWSFFD